VRLSPSARVESVSSLVESISGPEDVARLETDDLVRLAGEVRSLIVDTVSRTGGHLAPNLGVVELTVALLKVFAPPEDKIVWDTSHQTYAYKILTGRRDRFRTLRQKGGISGFAKRDESPCDAFGSGHAGTALSAALGLAAARDARGSKESVVAVMGDAAASCGISFEALNNIASATNRLVVILNDNEMSISTNVGSVSRYLGHLLVNPRYNRWKSSVESAAHRLLGMNWLRGIYHRTEEAVKSLFLDSVFFEEFGLRYIGPIDGHSIPALVDALAIARNYAKPIILHVSTKKGKGYPMAEQSPEKWHGTAAFDVESGVLAKEPSGTSYSTVFGRALERMAARDNRIVAITAAMCSGTGLSGFSKRFPDRFHDVGICEEHATILAAGMAAGGLRPFFAVYSTFAQRSVDCIIHDVCLQNLPVVFCLDRAGVVGDDGPTHHGVFDIALLRPVPNLVIMQPKDEQELADMLYTASTLDGASVIRYPRGCGPGIAVRNEFETMVVGKAEILREGETVQIWALGDMIPNALEAAALLSEKGVSAGVVNARFVAPLDEELMLAHASAAKVIATLENGVARGGFGSGVQECLSGKGATTPVLRFGWPHEFVGQGKADELMRDHGLDAETVVARILSVLSNGKASS